MFQRGTREQHMYLDISRQGGSRGANLCRSQGNRLRSRDQTHSFVPGLRDPPEATPGLPVELMWVRPPPSTLTALSHKEAATQALGTPSQHRAQPTQPGGQEDSQHPLPAPCRAVPQGHVPPESGVLARQASLRKAETRSECQ